MVNICNRFLTDEPTSIAMCTIHVLNNLWLLYDGTMHSAGYIDVRFVRTYSQLTNVS